MQRIVDSAIDIAPYNVKIHGTYIGPDGQRCLTDGYRGVQIWDDSIIMPADAPEKGDVLNLSQFIKNYSGLPQIQIDRQEVDNLLKIKKAEIRGRLGRLPKNSKYMYCIGNTYVNTLYLLDMLDIFPDATIYKDTDRLKPLYFETTYGNGILLPINYKGLQKNEYLIN